MPATYTTASSVQTLAAGDTVRVLDGYADGERGDAGRTYAYRGFVADYDIALADFQSTDGLVVVQDGNTVRVPDASATVGYRVYRYVGDEDDRITLDLSAIDYADEEDDWSVSDETTPTWVYNQGSQRIKPGETVRSRSGTIYEYDGDDDGGNKLNLAFQDYTDDDLWE